MFKQIASVMPLLFMAVGNPQLAPAWGPTPMAVLAQKADVILVATIQTVTDNPAVGDVVQLAVSRVIKGQPGSMQITAAFVRMGRVPGLVSPQLTDWPKSGELPGTWVGRTGVWFLQSASPYYQVIPTMTTAYSAADAFLPVVNGNDTAASQSTVVQQVLWYQTQWYLSLAKPGNGDDMRVFNSLGSATPADFLFADSLLLNSGLPDQVAVGLEAGLQRNSDDAVSPLAAHVDVAKASAKFTRLLGAFDLFYHPKGEGALPALRSLLSQHPAIPGLDSALATALARIGTKNILPSMAEMLGSQEPQAQLRAASFFGNFAMFADGNGNIPGTQSPGPFDSVGGRANTPKRGSMETPAEYAQFWNAWWSTNRAALGFPAP